MDNVNQFSDLAEYLEYRIRPFKNLTITQLSESLRIPIGTSNKVLTSMIAKRLLATIVQEKWKEELEENNYSIRTLTINPANRIKESLPLIRLDFDAITHEIWETSCLKAFLVDTSFLFLIFKESKDEVKVLYDVKLWKMKQYDVEECSQVWRRVKNLITEHNIVVDSSTNQNNLPKTKNHRIMHVRPHAKNSLDMIQLQNGVWITKQSFWINNSYLGNILVEQSSTIH